MDQFLSNLGNPTINSDLAKELDASLSLEELYFSMKEMQSNKAPGPDGFAVEFLKKCIDKLAPLNGLLPPTLTQASIAFLLKNDKDPVVVFDICLNADVKVLTKTNALHLERVCPSIIWLRR